MTYHATNRNNKEIIITNIPWNPATYTNRFQAGDWISKRNSGNNTTLEWIYHVTRVTPNTVQTIEFQRVTPTALIRVANSQVITLSPKGYHPIRVLFQERHRAPYKIAKELPSLTKLPLLWIFEFGFIDGTQESGTSKPPPKWVTLFFLAIPQNEVIETQGNPLRTPTSAPSFKG